MNPIDAIPVLDELFGILCRSLPAYLANANVPAWSTGELVRAALDRLVADQRMYAHRVAEAIAARGGRPNPARFPTEFAAKNDLSLKYLLPAIIDLQRGEVAAIESCVVRLEGESALHALAEEILGNAKGHLDILAGMMRDG